MYNIFISAVFSNKICIRYNREPLTTADVTTADSTANVSTADVLVLGYDMG